MNCEKCQDLLSDFLEGTLSGQDSTVFGAHLEECLSCADVREELHSIVNVAREVHELDVAPPNARALWVRIRNSVEIELEASRAAEAAAASAAAARSGSGFWADLMSKRWELSLPQLTTAVATLVFVVVTVTVVGVQGWRTNETASGSASSSSGASDYRGGSNFDAAADALYHETYLQQQETRINYWKQRAEARKASWNPQLRNSYENSVNVLDQAIAESWSALQRDPHDEIAREMLDSAIRGKMQLLQDFSDQ
ncbi:MAG TPA: zf-HC2 domain-containing protein [Pyrinomonadaceae bacterium]|jgi:hypothetical protein